jgi:hypothetical protein
MKIFTISMLIVASVSMFAQTESKPELSATEKMALTLVQQDFTTAQQQMSKAQQELVAFKEDFAKSHPGWKFDEQKGIVETPKNKSEK